MDNRLVRTKGDRCFDWVNIALLCIVLLITLYPLYFCFIASLSDPIETAQGNVLLYPKGFTLNAYKYVFEERSIWIGYRNSFIYMFGGTALALVLTIPAAYVLSKEDLPKRKLITWIYLFTMYFSGGMIPTYLVIRKLHLLNTPTVMILLGALSISNMIVARTYYSSSIPTPIYEAAYMDGAGEIRTFFSIALPLSTPIIAVIALYYAVARWNGFFNALLYLSDREYFPLQLVLRNILLLNQNMSMGEMMDDDYLMVALERSRMAEVMKYALIFISSIPVIVLYMFTQKYFIRGLTVGAVKG